MGRIRAPGPEGQNPRRPRAMDTVRTNWAVAEYVERALERGEYPVALVPPAAFLRTGPGPRTHTEHAEHAEP
ncbi:hypothetical protein [Streptomyces sp. NPDC003247]|uniref:hypothetical protein n=1 Tax=Streptomyces sp. NPDC003247 TaxID=3364677 RepID=UPI003686DA58